MKRRQLNCLSLSGNIYQVLIVLMMILITSCKEEDTFSSTIETEKTTVEFNTLNNCSSSAGTGTEFYFETPYTTSPGVTVKSMHIKTIVSNGESKEAINNSFSDNDNVIIWGSCFHFGPLSWFEFHVQLEASDGTLSNPSVIRVDRPNGAQ